MLYSTVARGISLMSILWLPVCAFVGFTDALWLALYCCAFAVVIALCELSFVCPCLGVCVRIAEKFRGCDRKRWIRGTLYIGLSIIGFLVYAKNSNIIMLLGLIGVMLNGILHIFTHFKESPDATEGGKQTTFSDV